MFRWKSAIMTGSAVLALAGAATAQTPPGPTGGQTTAAPPATSSTDVSSTAPANSGAPLYDPNQLPAITGQVRQFTLTGRGDIDGLILTDGTEVDTPPHLSTQIAFSVKPGDTVLIHGLHAAALPLVQAVSITDQASGRSVIDNGPPPPGPGPAPPPPPPGPEVTDTVSSTPIPGLTEVQGRVRMALHGPRGDVNGALLEDGTVLRLPPSEATRFTTLLQPGQALIAEGNELVSPLGRILEVRQLGASRTQLSLVAGPPGRGRRPPPPGPDAAPPPPPRP